MTANTSGTCNTCGANMILNPKTQKWFCEKKCWLGGQEGKPVEKQPFPGQRGQGDAEKTKQEAIWKSVALQASVDTWKDSDAKNKSELILATARKYYTTYFIETSEPVVIQVDEMDEMMEEQL